MQQQIGELRAQFSQSLDSNARSIQQQLGQMLGHVNERLRQNAEVLDQTQQTLGERLDNAARVVGDVQRSLGGLEEANRRIYEVGKDIASLQEILRAQILPAERYSIQHRFQSGEKVDVVIRLGPSLVPVDAKFPGEFQADPRSGGQKLMVADGDTRQSSEPPIVNRQG
jgi:DNA anti-recombination protein RmuC